MIRDLINTRQKNKAGKIILSLILLLIALSLSGCNQPEPPKLILSEESWYFGELAPDQKPSHHFVITNEGEKALMIDSVYSSCACVTLELAEKEIPPGHETQLTATFDPYGYEGEVSKTITIKSNDSDNPEKKIEVSITVQHVPNPDLVLSQQLFDLGDISLAEKEKQTIQLTISNKGDAELIVEDIVMEEYFSHKIETPINIAPGENVQADIFLDISQLKEGEFRKAVRIMTNDPQNQAVFLRIMGNIK